MDSKGLVSVKDKMAKKYMDSVYGAKFDDEFGVIDAEYAGFASKADNFTMSSKRFKDCYIRVRYFEDKYTTDYMEIHYYKQYQQYMKVLFEKIFGECNVLLDFTLNPSVVYTEETTFKEFLQTTQSLKSLMVFVKDTDKLDEKVLVLLERLKGINVPLGAVRFITLKNYEDAKSFASKNEWVKYERVDKNKSVLKFYNYFLNRNYEIRSKREGEWK